MNVTEHLCWHIGEWVPLFLFLHIYINIFKYICTPFFHWRRLSSFYLMIKWHWVRWRLCVLRQKSIAWANVDLDLCSNMASLGHNELWDLIMVSHAVWKPWLEGLSRQKRGRGFCRNWGPRAMFFLTAWETMIKSYYSTLTDCFFFHFVHRNFNFSALKWAIRVSHRGCYGSRTVAMDWLPRDTNE